MLFYEITDYSEEGKKRITQENTNRQEKNNEIQCYSIIFKVTLN